MPCSSTLAFVSLPLTEHNWQIHAGNADAARVVTMLADAMSLALSCRPITSEPLKQRRELWVFVDPGVPEPRIHCDDIGAVFCLLPPLADHDKLVVGMSVITQALARAELSRGALLIHGALISAPGPRQYGVILAGPGTVGKTTASNRLPPPWRSLCDDTSFVDYCRSGGFMAHPWPTWSRFFRDPDGKPGPGGKWDVRNGLPLKAIFFLARGREDQITPLPVASAMAFLKETVQQVSFLMPHGLPDDQARLLHHKQLAAAEQLVRAIPAFTLRLSLTGSFWNLIAETLNGMEIREFSGPEPIPLPNAIRKGKQPASPSPSLFDQGTLVAAYSGSSMKPTFRHPDLVEVVPYNDRPIRPGDVIYYQPATGGQKVIHRVVRITANGIATRGDNNCPEDPLLLQPRDVIGQVIAAWRYEKRREIAGGIAGICSVYRTWAANELYKFARAPLHKIYHALAKSGFLNALLPASLQPRIYEFKQGNFPSKLKLMVNGRVIGRYDSLQKLWEITPPWRLIIDVSQLPDPARSPAHGGQKNTSIPV
ncbi:MAG: SynChlorMet cassette protein ScmC [Desulfobulbus sp.]|nr:MAG: SynChlorMet cassette protein ScmC [Desulfobulbus sp.]